MSSPRIIAGKARGIRLKSVPGTTTRPITDRVKEALFNILASDIYDCDFLDAYAGTGSVGIEALSRGARYVRMLDIVRPAVETIRMNLKTTHLEKDAEVLLSDSLAYLSRTPDKTFDYIYIAPPQYKNLWKRTLEIIDSNMGWLDESGWVIVQIDPVEYEEMNMKVLSEFDQRRYGSTLLVFYELMQS